MQFRILGPLEVAVGDEVLDLGPRKQRTLFALLLTHHGRTVSTDRILDALWGDDAAGKERALWVYISRLRSIIAEATADEVLVTRDHGYSLVIDADAVDAVAFERLAERGKALLVSDPRSASETLTSALTLWRGNALEEFAYDEWAQPEIARLANLRRLAVDDRIEADLLVGRGGVLIGELEANVQERPYDETPVRQLMLALYRTGRHTDALRTFERFRRTLGTETGTEPSPELRRLEEQVLFHDPRIATTSDQQELSGAANPYRGLNSFREEDAHLFFGRDPLVAELIGMVGRTTIVTLVGPSGSGKSSVVRSGVVSKLRKGAIPGSDRWLVATMVPGTHPFIELEAALLRTRLDAPDSLRAQLDGQPNEVLRAALRISPTEDAFVLIVVDQFEELFTSTDPDQARRFLDAIVDASADPRGRVRFVLTLRADFYDRPLAHPRFGTAMASGIVNVVPMAPEELEQAASGPARAVGVRLEPGLEATLIGDVLGQPGALPLFEFALTDLFDRRLGDTMTLEAYRAMGGIDGAISRAAERVFERLTAAQQAAARQVFLRLVTLSSDGSVWSSRRVEASEVLDLDLDVGDLQAVVESFGRERLLSFDRSGRTGAPTVQVAHEALLDQWNRLRDWIDDAIGDLATNARLMALAAEWEDHGRSETYLLSAGRYDDYAAWATRTTLVLGRREAEYLAASEVAHASREAAEAERSAREERTARRARRTLSVLAGVVAVVVLGVGALIWWLVQPPPPMVAYLHVATESGDIPQMMESGLDAAARELGVEVVDYPIHADPAARVLEAIDDGAALIVLGTTEFRWIAASDVDPGALPVDLIVIDDPGIEPSANMTIAVFDEPQGAYLMGVAAAEASSTGRVGIVGGWQGNYLEAWLAAYEQGAESVDPDVEVIAGWVAENGSVGFGRADLAYTRALAMYDEGVDVIFQVAGEAGEGVITAARDYSLAHEGEKVWAIGVDSDQGLLASTSEQDHILTSMIKHFDNAVVDAMAAWDRGEAGGYRTFDLANGGIDYADGHEDFAVILPVLDAAREGIVEGSIVPRMITALATSWTTEPDAVVPVTLDEQGCRLDEATTLRPGDIVRFRFTNAAADVGFVQLWQIAGDVDRAALLARIDSSTTPVDVWVAFDDMGADPWGNWAIPGGATYELPMELYTDDPTAGFIGCFVGENGRPHVTGPIEVASAP